jgi:hypothetical protein
MSTPEQQARLLSVIHRLIDQELKVNERRLFRRLGIIWLLVGPAILVSATVVANRISDYTGRPDLKPGI